MQFFDISCLSNKLNGNISFIHKIDMHCCLPETLAPPPLPHTHTDLPQHELEDPSMNGNFTEVAAQSVLNMLSPSSLPSLYSCNNINVAIFKNSTITVTFLIRSGWLCTNTKRISIVSQNRCT